MANFNPIELKNAMKDQTQWKQYVDNLYLQEKPTNQSAQGWKDAMYKLPQLLSGQLPSSASGLDKDAKRDWNEYYGQYETSLSDITNILNGNGTLGQLGEAVKQATWGYNNINQLLKERTGTETTGVNQQNAFNILRQQVLSNPNGGKALDKYFQVVGLENNGANLSMIQKGLTPLTQSNAEALWKSKFGESGNMAENISYALNRGASLEDFAKEISANPVDVQAIGKGLTKNGVPVETTQPQSTGQQTLFSGTLTEGKAYTDNQGRYYKYQNGQWQKVDQNTYNSASQKGIIAPQEGNWMEGQIGETTGANSQTPFFGTTPNTLDSIKNSPAYQNLNADQKAMIDLVFQSNNATSPEQKAKIDLAIQEAIKISDPWTKEQLRIVQDELKQNVSGIEGDYSSQLKTSQDRIKQLKEDLIFNKGELTFAQQQDMTNQVKEYETKMFNTQQQMAESGLAFSSPRATAESNLLNEQQGVAQSTAHKYTQAFREQELNASRGITTEEQKLADLERKRLEKLTVAERAAETAIGSVNTPNVSGVTPIGGITGTTIQQGQQKTVDWVGNLTTNPLTQMLK